MEQNSGLGPCVIWDRARNRQGYGVVRIGGKNLLAHRVAYAASKGIEVSAIAGQCVLHACDTPACVNPKHLSLGTHVQNMREAAERKRMMRREGHTFAKLTDAQVEWVRAVYVPYHSEFGGAALARKLGVNQSNISRVVRGQAWT